MCVIQGGIQKKVKGPKHEASKIKKGEDKGKVWE